MNINYVDITHNRINGIRNSFGSGLTGHKLENSLISNKDDAVVVGFSEVGKLKSRNRPQTADTSIRDSSIAISSKIKTIEDIMKKARAGEELSDKDQDKLLDSMKDEVRKKYEWGINRRLDSNDIKVLSELKDEYIAKQNALESLAAREKYQNIGTELDEQDAKQTQDMAEIAYKKREEEMLEESLEEVEKTNDDAADSEEVSDTSETSEVVNVSSDTAPAEGNITIDNTSIRKTLELDTQFEKAFEGIEDTKHYHSLEQKELNTLMNNAYKEALETIDSNEFSLKEKLFVYDEYMENMNIFSFDREVARISKEFNSEALLDIKIAALGKNISIADIMLGRKSQNAAGQTFIKNSLK